MQNVNFESHPSDTDLLLALEGELSPSRAAYIQKHLELCWRCRVATQRHRDGIYAWITYEQQATQTGSRPPNEWSHFTRKLNEVADQCDRSSHFLKLSVERGRPLWLSISSAAVILLLVVLLPLSHPSVLSAKEFLRHVTASRKAGSAQYIRITAGNKSITRHLRNTSAGTARRPDIQELEFKTIFHSQGLNWSDPLDPQNFIAWREQLVSKHDSITRRDGELELRTTTTSGPVREGALVVTAADWQPLREEFQFDNGFLLTISEMKSYPMEANVAKEEMTHRSLMTTAPTPAESQISDTEFLPAEIRARVALHSVQADLGEPLEVNKSTAGNTTVTGTVSTPEKLANLHAALAGIAGVEDHASLETTASSSEIANMPTEVTTPAASRPVVRERITTLLPDATKRMERVNSILADSQDLLIRVWALKKLAERYTPSVEKQLDAQSSEMLQMLVKDHAKALSEIVTKLQLSLAFLEAGSSDPDPRIHSLTLASDWQSKTQLIFRLVQESDHICNRVIFGPENDISGIELEARQLEQTYRTIRSALREIEPFGAH